jgi:hypothetical protein
MDIHRNKDKILEKFEIMRMLTKVLPRESPDLKTKFQGNELEYILIAGLWVCINNNSSKR